MNAPFVRINSTTVIRVDKVTALRVSVPGRFMVYFEGGSFDASKTDLIKALRPFSPDLAAILEADNDAAF